MRCVRRHGFAIAALALAAIHHSAAFGQVPLVPKLRVANADLPGTSATDLKALSEAYFAGNWKALQEKAVDLLHKKTVHGDEGKSFEVDTEKQHLRVGFLGTNPVTKEPMLIQFLVHSPSPPAFADRLPGVGAFFQLYLTEGSEELRTLFLASEEADPRVASIVAAGQKLPMESLVPLAWYSAAAATTPPSLKLTVGEISLPFKRGQIAQKSQVKPAPSPPVLKELQKAETELSESLLSTAAPLSACARSMVSAVSNGFVSILGADHGWDAIGGRMKQELERVSKLKECQVVSEPDLSGAGGAAFSAREAHLRLVNDVRARYMALVSAPVPKPVASESTIANVPLQRYSLGFVGALMIGDSAGDKRVKLDGGKIQADPFKGTLTQVVVNFHPRAYDPKSVSATSAEKLRLTVGAAVTPEFGISLGVGYALVRGLSVNAGAALLRVNGRRSGDIQGEAPSDLKKPFRNTQELVYFLGLGFNL